MKHIITRLITVLLLSGQSSESNNASDTTILKYSKKTEHKALMKKYKDGEFGTIEINYQDKKFSFVNDNQIYKIEKVEKVDDNSSYFELKNKNGQKIVSEYDKI